MTGAGLNILQMPRRFVTSRWGGTETMILETSRRLDARGHHVEILTSMALAGQRTERVGGIEVRRARHFYPWVGLTEGARADLDLKGGNLFSVEALGLLATWGPLDLIHLHTGKRFGGIGRTAARIRGIPYVVTLHGGVMDVPEGEARSLAAPTEGALEWGKPLGWLVGSRRVLEDAAAVLCVGPEERRRVQASLPRARVEHLPNGVDAARFEGGDGAAFRAAWDIPPDAPLLLVLGRIDPQKDQALALDVLAALKGDVPKLHLVIAGPETDPAYARALRARIEGEGLAGAVRLTGQLDPSGSALRDALKAADVLLLPSRHEPFGIVALEAWAAGLPVVASRVGGIPSFVDDGADGLLAPPGDVDAFAAACRRLLSDAPLRRRLAEAGALKARGPYSWDRITGQLEALYLEVVSARALRH